MKAIVRRKFGSPDGLNLEEIQKPIARDNEVLVEIHAASANAGDWELLRADPLLQFIFVQLYFRLVRGELLRSHFKVPGADIAGRVEAIGKNVKQFRPGDEVFGDLTRSGFGAFAEYACVSEDAALGSVLN